MDDLRQEFVREMQDWRSRRVGVAPWYEGTKVAVVARTRGLTLSSITFCKESEERLIARGANMTTGIVEHPEDILLML